MEGWGVEAVVTDRSERTYKSKYGLSLYESNRIISHILMHGIHSLFHILLALIWKPG
jgi:hypothetical protein